MTQLQTPAQTPKPCKSCGQEGHCRSSSRKCPHYRPQKKARHEAEVDIEVEAIEPVEIEESKASASESDDSDLEAEASASESDGSDLEAEASASESDDSDLEADATFVATEGEKDVYDEPEPEPTSTITLSNNEMTPPPETDDAPWWCALYTPLARPDEMDEYRERLGDGFDCDKWGFDQYDIKYNPMFPPDLIERDVISNDETLDAFLDAHKIATGEVCSHTAIGGYRGGRWFIPLVLNTKFLVLFFRDSILAKRPIPICEKFLRDRNFWFFVDWEMETPAVYRDFLDKNGMEDLQFLQEFGKLCVFSRFARARFLFSRNPDFPNKIHINFPAVSSSMEEAKEMCTDLQSCFLSKFYTDDPAWNWDKIFEKGPYNNGGLRILGARKEGQRKSYQIIDLRTGQYEPLHIQQLVQTTIRIEYSKGTHEDYPSKKILSEYEVPIRRFTADLDKNGVFPSQTLDIVDIKSGFDNRSFVVDLKDEYCPYIGRAHSRSSHYMHLFITRFGCWLKCYDEDCKERHDHQCKDLPQYIRDMFDDVEQELDPEGVKSIVKQEWANGDKGIAKIVHHFLHKNAMYSTSTKSLYHYSEARCLWEIVTQNEFKWTMSDTIEKALRPLVKKYVDDAANEPDKKKKEMLDQWASDVLGIIKKYSSTRALSLLYPLFEGIVTYPDVESKFDKIPHLLGVRNGVIDLRTGELRNRTREDGIFRVSPIVYDPEADVSFIEDMYSAIMADDEEMKRFLQLCLGYVITGETKEEIVLVFTGVGRNGKGGTIQTIKKIMGAFMATLNNGLILKRKGGNRGNMDAERGRFRGIRIALFNEIGDGEVLNTAELQMFSGRDGISINEKYMTPTEIENPSHKCIITTNWSPAIPLKEVTTSIIERLIIINFPVTFTDLRGEEPTIHRRQAVRELKDNLAKKLHVFLKWIVTGAVAYYWEGGGLKAKSPQKVKKSTAEYFEKQDTVRKFVDQECIRGDTGEFSEECNSFFAQFQEFDNRVDRTNFVFGLNQLGITSKQVRIPGTKFRQSRYFGVRLRPVESLEEGVRDDAEPNFPVI